MPAVNDHIRVHVRTQVNTQKIRREKRNGREVIIVPSATLPDDCIMNGILYPKKEIANSFLSLERTPAPAGHPMVNGQFVSASDPEGINQAWIGAWNENVRQEGGRVLLDKVIDVANAERSEKGPEVLEALEKGEPIHTSTGLECYLKASDSDDYDFIAHQIVFDHDAILINEEGAATPADGVGIFVNSEGKPEQLEVINSLLEDVERDLDWAADMAVRAVDKLGRVSLVERVKSAILDAIPGVGGEERETSATKGNAEMADDKQLSELSAKVDKITEILGNIGDVGKLVKDEVTEAFKPFGEQLDQIQNAQKADAEERRANAVNELVKTGQWEEDDLKDMPLTAINKLLAKAKPKKSKGLNSAKGGDGDEDIFNGYDMNANLKSAQEGAQ